MLSILGMEWVRQIKFWSGIGYLQKLRYESSSGHRKTLLNSTCITSKVIHRQKGLEYENAKFSMATKFFNIHIMWQASNQSILSLRLAGTTADLIPYPFLSGIEDQILVFTFCIQGPVPSLIYTILHARLFKMVDSSYSRMMHWK